MTKSTSRLFWSLLSGLLVLPQAAFGQNLSIHGVTIDTGTGETLGTLSSQGGMDEFVRIQKEMVLSVLKQLGIDIQTLPPHIRGQIEKPQTTNAQALSAFAKGLDLADKGQFKEAAAAFQEAAKNDPGFSLASGASAMREMRQNANNEGQQQANQQLEQMNQPGNDMGDLGLSEGGGGGETDPSMDPMSLVTNQDENPGNQQNFDDSSGRLVTINEIKTPEDIQRDPLVDRSNSLVGEYQGFAAGYHEYNPDGYVYNSIASGSPSSVQIHFRPGEGQVDVSLVISGDMLANTNSPVVSFNIESQCASGENNCGYGDNAYSDYFSPQTFWAYQHNAENASYDELVSGYYYSDNNQFSHSSWGYWQQRPDSNDMYNNYAEGFWVAGDLTPAASIPNTGTAVYSGGMVGVTQYGDYLEGTMNWSVNFSSRNVSGSFDNITKNGQAWLSSTAVSGGWSAGTNAVSASISGANVSSGIAKGAFFGPNAEELGGSWRINHTNGDKGAGIFLGKPGGVPFQSSYRND